MNEAAPAEEWVFADRYRVDALIGSGGMGAVWSGYDRHLDRRVAIKLMRSTSGPVASFGSAESAAFAEAAAADRERFLREIRTTAKLELPGIPAVYDFGVEESTGRIYLVMQLVYGQTLEELIASRDYAADPWPISWAAAITAQAAATLVDVHRVDVVHRDIKPLNLMVTDGGLVKVLDFGVAILRGASALPRLTQIGHTVGSPPYMPPEQALGNPVGPASDVYALGCVLYQTLTGRVPFLETANRSYQDHHVNTPAPSARMLRPDVPANLDDLIAQMLAKRPADRPTAEAVYEKLLPLAARPGTAGAGGNRDPRRPFLRPLAPAPRQRGAAPAAKPTRATSTPLSVDEAIEIRQRVGDLVEDSQFQQAIDLLDEAVERAAAEPALKLEMQVALASTLWFADEFSRVASVLDEILPKLDGGDDMAVLYYYSGVSNAEIGNIDEAITRLTEFLALAEPYDPLHRDATYRLGMMLPAVGRATEGLRHLEALRPILVAEYGPESVHVKTLDGRIAQIRRGPDL
ncbi:serine/threonine-protein kinase [Micromonospora globbae]|uniref:non-specific serine/threonine protein kinase n=1 Tax=Micromonospora globbae TaxID=1894969 RepID=A0A420EXP4_9ACTN|nr:serine/threonine-protein kinase [Micromonospora globbae]RKF25536.1 serine/threonine protein kinase [Micromonospora globbae]